jgi:hypothetical protein
MTSWFVTAMEQLWVWAILLAVLAFLGDKSICPLKPPLRRPAMKYEAKYPTPRIPMVIEESGLSVMEISMFMSR